MGAAEGNGYGLPGVVAGDYACCIGDGSAFFLLVLIIPKTKKNEEKVLCEFNDRSNAIRGNLGADVVLASHFCAGNIIRVAVCCGREFSVIVHFGQRWSVDGCQADC